MSAKQQTAADIRKKLRDSIRLLATPQGRAGGAERVQAAKFLKGQSSDLLAEAATDAGVELDSLPTLIEQYAPTPAPEVEYEPIPPNRRVPLSQRKKKEPPKKPEDKGPQGAPPSRFDPEQGRGGVGPRGYRNEDSQPRPTIEDALGAEAGPGPRRNIDALRSRQSQQPTGENIAREAARNRPLSSFTRAEQFLEDMESTSGPFPLQTRGQPLVQGEEGPEEMPIPRATYEGKGSGRGLGPGGKAAGTQEDYRAFRTKRDIDERLAERERQARIEFLRRGGRYAADGVSTVVGGQQVSLDRADGQRVAVVPGRGKTPMDQRSGAYAYADELRDESRAAMNQRNKETAENFTARIETDRIRKAEAEEFLASMKDQIRTTEKVARDLKRGNVSTGSSENLNSFFESLDKVRSTKAQIQGKSQNQQVEWARNELDARRERQRQLEEEERERQQRVARASFQDIVTTRRNTMLDRY